MKKFTQDSLIITSRQELIDIILEQAAQIDKLSNAITEHSMQLEWLKRQMFGTKSERFVEPDDLQTALELGIVVNNVECDTETTTILYDRKKSNAAKESVKGHGRGVMPTHLPIKKTTIEPVEDTSGMTRLGEEETWYYEMDKPASLHIVLIKRPKYALPNKTGVVIGTLPALPVEKGNAGPGFLAHITNEKYLYHMPLERQRKKFKHEYNSEFSSSWLSDNVGKTVFWFEPVYEGYRGMLLKSTYLQGDETPIQVLTRDGKGKTHKGYLWVYHDPIQRIVLFDYRKNRSHKGPSEFLKNFHGTLQVDGYEGYADIIKKNGLIHAGCMDHVRRRFDKALSFDKARASYALETMKAWYMVEREAKEQNLTFDERLALRKQNVAESMAAFKTWMLQQLVVVLPKSPIGVALQYALNQWDYFNPYLNDGRVELSNILIENAIRPITLGRKNFFFVGSHNAARWPAVIYSLAAIAKNYDIYPFEYFKELLTELPKATTSDIGKFLIPEWKPKPGIV